MVLLVFNQSLQTLREKRNHWVWTSLNEMEQLMFSKSLPLDGFSSQFCYPKVITISYCNLFMITKLAGGVPLQTMSLKAYLFFFVLLWSFIHSLLLRVNNSLQTFFLPLLVVKPLKHVHHPKKVALFCISCCTRATTTPPNYLLAF